MCVLRYMNSILIYTTNLWDVGGLIGIDKNKKTTYQRCLLTSTN